MTETVLTSSPSGEPQAGRAEDRRVDPRAVLVTGAGRGLGAAIARELAGAGWGVMVADLDGDAARDGAARIRSSGGDATSIAVDVADEASARGAVEAVMGTYGRLDVLVNNAGTDVTAAFDAIDAAAWDRVLDVNLRGPANMVRAALPHLGRTGDIVNITSTAAKRAWPEATAYHASKWGLLGLSHALHAELRGRGIRVTAMVCGGMRTPFLIDRFPHLDPERLMDPARVASAIRWVLDQPRDVAVAELTLLPLTEDSWP